MVGLRRAVLALVAASLTIPPAAAQNAGKSMPSEYQVKAAFLYHFAQLVEWPATGPRAAVFEIGLVGDDVFGPALQEIIAGKTVHQRPIEVRRYDGLEEVRRSPPQVLFVGTADAREARRVLRVLDGAPVLTVSDVKGFAEHGGMIGFRLTPDGRVAFDINLPRVENTGLRMSSQLLKLARIVREP